MMVFVLFALCICLPSVSANAQSGNLTNENKVNALALAQTIYDKNLIAEPNLDYANIEFHNATPEGRLQVLRQITTDTLAYRNSLDVNKINDIYKTEARTQKSSRDLSIIKINTIYIKLSRSAITPEVAENLVHELRTYQSHPDWFVANRAYIIQATYEGGNLKLATALTEIQKARQLIPTTPSNYVTEAIYETNDTIAYLYLLLNNPELGIAATEQVISQGLAQNRNINGIDHIGNLAYVFEKWRDYETAAKLTEIIIALSEKNNLGVNSLAYLRYGQSLNNLREYSKAKPYLQKALKNEKSARIKLSLESQLAISLAGMGDSQGAKESFKRFDLLAKDAGINTTGFSKRKLHAQALLAVARGDAEATYQLVNTQLNQEMEQTYKRIGATAQTQLAELENSKQRQEEREAAQKREIALKQKEIEAQQRNVILLVSLAVSLSFITLGAIAIAAWRQRTNRTLTAAAHIAEAGDREKTQFLGVITHELRTPLNPIIGISGLLCEYGETQTIRDQNKIIRDEGNNLLETLNGIIDMSQMLSGTLKIVTAPTNLHQIVDNLYRIHKAGIDTSAIQFTCHIAKDIPNDIMIDSLRIKQSLSNLISNAIKFTQKGRIHIHVTLSPADAGNIRTLTMIVADTGQGVSQESQDKLFKPFIQADSSMTRNHGGAGVGLSVTRGLARLMGGDITMNSAPGRGSEFTFTVKTCYAQDAELDLSTNRRTFIAEPSTEQIVNFSTTISIEKLTAQQAEKTKKEKKEKKAERKLEKIRAAAIGTDVPEATTLENNTIETPIEMEDIMPKALLSEDRNNEIEDQTPAPVEQAHQSTHAFEENDLDFLELEQLLEPDSEQEFETVGSPSQYASQAELNTTPLPNPYAPAPQPVAPTAPTISIPVETITAAPIPAQASTPVPETKPVSRNAFTRQTSRVTDGAISHDQLEGLNILVVEDMLANQVVLRALLEPVGCQVTMADHGGKALETMQTQMFDVILMDIRMPVMDGIETTENIRKTPGPHQNVPIIALTADASAETNAQCLAAGADVFLTKPVIVSELFSSIRFVREKQTRQKPNTALSA